MTNPNQSGSFIAIYKDTRKCDFSPAQGDIWHTCLPEESEVGRGWPWPECPLSGPAASAVHQCEIKYKTSFLHSVDSFFFKKVSLIKIWKKPHLSFIIRNDLEVT